MGTHKLQQSDKYNCGWAMELTHKNLCFLSKNIQVFTSITGGAHRILFRNVGAFDLSKRNFIQNHKKLLNFSTQILQQTTINKKNKLSKYITQVKLQTFQKLIKGKSSYLEIYNGMNKQQAVINKIDAEKYMETHKLRPLFHQLTKLLLLKKPQNPIQFLIDYIDNRNKKQVVCIHGYDEEKRIKLAKNVSIKFNYKLIELAELFKGTADWNGKPDKEINQKLINQLNKVESVYKGIIISGYPNNIVQADFLQKSGVLPQRYFLLENNQKQIKRSYQLKYEGNIDKMLERNQLQLKELNQILVDLVDNLPSNIQSAIQIVVSTLGVKANRKMMPYDSVRVCVLHPPFLKPESSAVFSKIFCLNAISVNQTLKKLSNKPNFRNNVESYIRKYKSISKQIELAMIQTMTKTATSRNKGFALYGWPQTKDRLPLLKEHFLNPHIIFIFEDKKQQSVQKFMSLSPDNTDLFLVNQKPSRQQYSILYDRYEEMIDELKGKNNVHVFSYDQKQEKVISTFLSMIENPKIYS